MSASNILALLPLLGNTQIEQANRAIELGIPLSQNGFFYLSPYFYTPSLAANVVFLVLFALLTIAVSFQTIRYRTFRYSTMTIGGIAEIIGYGFRIWSAKSPTRVTPYQVQTIVLLIPPLFWLAAIYAITAEVIRETGPQFSPIPRKLYLIIFTIFDLIALILQITGSALVAAAAGGRGPKISVGSNIAATGVLVQILTMIAYTIVAVIFLIKAWHLITRSSALKQLTFAGIISMLAIYLRSFWRCVALYQGWFSPGLRSQSIFIGLEGVTLTVVMIMFAVFHPGRLLKHHRIARETGAAAVTGANTTTSEKEAATTNAVTA